MANHVKEERQTFWFDGAQFEPLIPTTDSKQYRTRVFKSGNSLAVRIPTGTRLAAGMEMDLYVEDGVILSLKPIDASGRKIDVSKFAGKAPWLKELTSEEREMEHRELDWHLLNKPGKKS